MTKRVEALLREIMENGLIFDVRTDTNDNGQGGTVSVVGIYELHIEKLDIGMAVVRDLNLICSVASPNTFKQTLRLMQAKKIQAAPLVTHVLPLAEAPRAFELQQHSTEERIKIHLEPPEDE